MNMQKKRDEQISADSSAVTRIGASVTQLKPLAGRVTSARPPVAPAAVSPQSVAAAKRMVRERLRRSHFFKADLFADPAWDMMLDVFIAEAEGRETPVMNLCLSSQVPETTTLRWVKTLEHEGIFIRQKDEHDQRRVLVRLSPEAAKAMARYLDDHA